MSLSTKSRSELHQDDTSCQKALPSVHGKAAEPLRLSRTLRQDRWISREAAGVGGARNKREF